MKNAEAVSEVAELGSVVAQHSGHNMDGELEVLADEVPSSLPFAALLSHGLQSSPSLTLHATPAALSNSAETPASSELPDPLVQWNIRFSHQW